MILFYGMVMFLSKDMSSRSLKAVLLGVTLLEISVNTLAVGVNSTVTRSEYVRDDDVTQATITYMEKKNPRNVKIAFKAPFVAGAGNYIMISREDQAGGDSGPTRSC